jgi:hypothetical protein
MPRAIVTSAYRYKRPPRKKKPVLLEVPAIVRKGAAKPKTTPAPANDDRKSAIVTVKRRKSRFGDAPDVTPEEHQRHGDAADALFRDRQHHYENTAWNFLAAVQLVAKRRLA